MFNDLQAPGIERRVVRDVSRQAGPFQMREIYTYRVAVLKGTVIELRNTSLIGQPLNSKSFLVPGLLAAAVSHEMVQPQQAGRVYLVEAAR
jgi:hypothetical protein